MNSQNGLFGKGTIPKVRWSSMCPKVPPSVAMSLAGIELRAETHI